MMTTCYLHDLRCEDLCSPLGLDDLQPRFSWRLVDSRYGACQTAYRLQVSGDPAFTPTALVFDSGKQDSAASVYVPYGGRLLEPLTRYHWRVKGWDIDGVETEWSEISFFETGFLSSSTPWPQAKWIGMSMADEEKLLPARYLMHVFQSPSNVAKARLYITARGLFEASINGQRVGEDKLTPGWTDYDKRLEYLTYDVTDLLQEGDNAIGVALGDGWYAGYLGWTGNSRYNYGEQIALYCALRIESDTGEIVWVSSGSDWKATTGAIRSADLYNGETYDARLEIADWATLKARMDRFQEVDVLDFPEIPLVGKAFGPVREIERLQVQAVSEPTDGVKIYDFGQNLVGVVSIDVEAPEGTEITLRYGEMLNADGTLYTANLRRAKCTDRYICKGVRGERYEPRFTFHGFRYLEVSGVPEGGEVRVNHAGVWHTEMPLTGRFSTSDARLNQLQSNIQWGQRGNFLEVPTDCPQRDERLGWTGDAQVFISTASYNYDIASFFRKWTRDLRDAQYANGAYSSVAPDVIKKIGFQENGGKAAWADAGVICPWVVYNRYGDVKTLKENYDSMSRWIEYQRETSTDLIRPDDGYGDWLTPDADKFHMLVTPRDLIGTAYFAYTSHLMAEIAQVLGRDEDARAFRKLSDEVKEAFNKHFVTSSGRVLGDTQTAYLLALAFDLLPNGMREMAFSHLVRTLERRDFYLATGFVGTPLLCPVLSRFGRSDLAYRLLFNVGYPSWLFPIKNGATTMWERWNSWTPEQGFGDVGMNSFNHYAYGAIGDWMYTNIVGIEAIEPGFKRIRLALELSDHLTEASGELNSPYGKISSKWKREGESLYWEIEIPPNSGAKVILPAEDSELLTVNGRTPKEASLHLTSDPEQGQQFYDFQAGRYELCLKIPAKGE